MCPGSEWAYQKMLVLLHSPAKQLMQLHILHSFLLQRWKECNRQADICQMFTKASKLHVNSYPKAGVCVCVCVCARARACVCVCGSVRSNGIHGGSRSTGYWNAKCRIYKYIYKGLGSSVGIATDYGLDGLGIKSQWGRDFSHMSRPALGPTQPPVQGVLGLSWGKAARAWCWPPTPF
jgi:hypothetical protein